MKSMIGWSPVFSCKSRALPGSVDLRASNWLRLIPAWAAAIRLLPWLPNCRARSMFSIVGPSFTEASARAVPVLVAIVPVLPCIASVY